MIRTDTLVMVILIYHRLFLVNDGRCGQNILLLRQLLILVLILSGVEDATRLDSRLIQLGLELVLDVKAPGGAFQGDMLLGCTPLNIVQCDISTELPVNVGHCVA